MDESRLMTNWGAPIIHQADFALGWTNTSWEQVYQAVKQRLIAEAVINPWPGEGK